MIDPAITLSDVFLLWRPWKLLLRGSPPGDAIFSVKQPGSSGKGVPFSDKDALLLNESLGVPAFERL
jgi:hypothetical protein